MSILLTKHLVIRVCDNLFEQSEIKIEMPGHAGIFLLCVFVDYSNTINIPNFFFSAEAILSYTLSSGRKHA